MKDYVIERILLHCNYIDVYLIVVHEIQIITLFCPYWFKYRCIKIQLHGCHAKLHAGPETPGQRVLSLIFDSNIRHLIGHWTFDVFIKTCTRRGIKIKKHLSGPCCVVHMLCCGQVA